MGKAKIVKRTKTVVKRERVTEKKLLWELSRAEADLIYKLLDLATGADGPDMESNVGYRLDDLLGDLWMGMQGMKTLGQIGVMRGPYRFKIQDGQIVYTTK